MDVFVFAKISENGAVASLIMGGGGGGRGSYSYIHVHKP